MSKKMPSHHQFQFMDRLWFNQYGITHRLAGPAIERSDGAKYWYLHGRCIRSDAGNELSTSDVAFPGYDSFWIGLA